MINEKECIPMILSLAPDFQDTWNSYLEEWKDWDGEKPGLCSEITEFARYLTKNFNSFKIEFLEKIFKLIEGFMVGGDQDVQDATATCFLESLQNAVDRKEISGKELFKLLGPQSIAYCRAWDEFNGCKTDGFWEDGTPYNPRKA